MSFTELDCDWLSVDASAVQKVLHVDKSLRKSKFVLIDNFVPESLSHCAGSNPKVIVEGVLVVNFTPQCCFGSKDSVFAYTSR